MKRHESEVYTLERVEMLLNIKDRGRGRSREGSTNILVIIYFVKALMQSLRMSFRECSGPRGHDWVNLRGVHEGFVQTLFTFEAEENNLVMSVEEKNLVIGIWLLDLGRGVTLHKEHLWPRELTELRRLTTMREDVHYLTNLSSCISMVGRWCLLSPTQVGKRRDDPSGVGFGRVLQGLLSMGDCVAYV